MATSTADFGGPVLVNRLDLRQLPPNGIIGSPLAVCPRSYLPGFVMFVASADAPKVTPYWTPEQYFWHEK